MCIYMDTASYEPFILICTHTLTGARVLVVVGAAAAVGRAEQPAAYWMCLSVRARAREQKRRTHNNGAARATHTQTHLHTENQ